MLNIVFNKAKTLVITADMYLISLFLYGESNANVCFVCTLQRV